MLNTKLLWIPMFASLAAFPALAQASAFAYPPVLEGAREEVYKTAGGVQLRLFIFTPPGHKAAARAPAIVFFFGGGWTSGSPKQFEQQCRFLAASGMVAIAADYRVASRHKVKAVDCVRDAKSAIRWVRQNAVRLGVDPGRIAAGGGSAGGHLAAAAGLIQNLDEPSEDPKISSRPDAMVLFNPAVVLAPVEGLQLRQATADLATRLGVSPEQLSPYHHIRPGAPPAVIFHGKADTTVPYATVEAFSRKMAAAGNRCELYGYDDATHGFFNYGRGDSQAYLSTLRRMGQFLESLGYLKTQ